MKKLLIGTLLLFLTCAVNAQYLKVEKATAKRYISGQWINVQTNYPNSIYLIFKDNHIKITNEAHSDYLLFGSAERDETVYYITKTYNCYNDDAKLFRCIIFINKETNNIDFIDFMREDLAFEYKIEN